MWRQLLGTKGNKTKKLGRSEYINISWHILVAVVDKRRKRFADSPVFIGKTRRSKT